MLQPCCFHPSSEPIYLTKQHHNYTCNTVFICIIVTTLRVKVYNPQMYTEVHSQHNFQCNSLSTFKHAMHIYIICLNSMWPIKHVFPISKVVPLDTSLASNMLFLSVFIFPHIFVERLTQSLMCLSAACVPSKHIGFA